MIIQNPRQINALTLIDLAKQAQGQIHHIYLHWTAGHYHQADDDYHINIDAEGQIYLTCNSLAEVKAHTSERNTGAIGITIDGCFDASAGSDPQRINFGTNPPTKIQLFVLIWVVALLCITLQLPISKDVVMTHEEAATEDGYGPGPNCERWDLWYLPDYFTQDNCFCKMSELLDGTKKPLLHGGTMIREIANKYAKRLEGKCIHERNIPLALVA